ncbi:MAG: response regulator [Lachnospiraceae bacterium]|nr:response regulator [Lachnospiraceae bacterium]
MNEGTKSIVIVVFQYSVVVKGIERKIRDAGYKVSILAEGFEKIRDLASSTDLFLLYLPGDIVDNEDRQEELAYICEKVNTSGRSMILIGETSDRANLFKQMPVIGDYTWLDRPIEMDALRPAIENAILGPGVEGSKKRILIVDDDPSYAKMVREWIKDDYQTDIVTAGMQAITFLLKNKVNLILLDYEMPVVDGPQVLQMLRQESETKDIPVVFLTGIGTKDSVQRVMALKPAGYILKSTTRESLLSYLKDKLGK